MDLERRRASIAFVLYSLSQYKVQDECLPIWFHPTDLSNLLVGFSINHSAFVMRGYLPIALASLLAGQARAGDDEWLSPVYKEIFQNELPTPPTKEKKYTYYNSTTNSYIDYYEVEIKPFEQQVYKGLKPAQLVGYGMSNISPYRTTRHIADCSADGVSPGPTFRMEKDREAVVRFVNHGEMDISVHLHGSYSRAPFDGW
jgi:bilirubin oxidase